MKKSFISMVFLFALQAKNYSQVCTSINLAGGKPETDGVSSFASFIDPYGCDIEGDSLYVVDYSTSSIRLINLNDSTVVTLFTCNEAPYDIDVAGYDLYVPQRNGDKNIVRYCMGSQVASFGNNTSRPYSVALNRLKDTLFAVFDDKNIYKIDTATNTAIKIVNGSVTRVECHPVHDTLYYIDSGKELRKVGFSGGEGITVASFAGGSGLCFDDNGDTVFISSSNGLLYIIDLINGTKTQIGSYNKFNYINGYYTSARFGGLKGIAYHKKSHSLYFTDNTYNVVRKMNIRNGIVSTFSGAGNLAAGQGSDALLGLMPGMDVSDKGILFLADLKNHCILESDSSGKTKLLTGKPMEAGYADSIGQETFNKPCALKLNANEDTLWVCELGNDFLRKVILTGENKGMVTTSSIHLENPRDITQINDTFYIARDNGITRIIGNTAQSLRFKGDFQIHYPWGIESGKDGRSLWVALYEEGKIIELTNLTDSLVEVSMVIALDSMFMKIEDHQPFTKPIDLSYSSFYHALVFSANTNQSKSPVPALYYYDIQKDTAFLIAGRGTSVDVGSPYAVSFDKTGKELFYTRAINNITMEYDLFKAENIYENQGWLDRIFFVNQPPVLHHGADSIEFCAEEGLMSIPGWIDTVLAGTLNEQQWQSVSLKIVPEVHDYFKTQPFIDEETGTINFELESGFTGETVLIIKLKDNGGLFYGGIDSSEYSLKIKIDQCTTTPQVRQGNSAMVFPNPAQEGFYVKTKRNASILLFSIDNKLIKQWNTSSEMEYISTLGLNKGIYIIEIREMNKVSREKIVLK